MVDTSPTITFKSVFSSGDSIAYGEVLIYSPGNSEVEYQNGRTDKNGVFSFLPDKTGIWKVEVDGGLGHKLMFDVNVSSPDKKDLTPDNKHVNQLQQSRPILAAFGISLIFNLALAPLYYMARKKIKIEKD